MRDAPRRTLVLVALLLAAFAINLDTTIINVALPSLIRELHATTSQLQWIVDAYNLVFAALVLAAGSVTDRVGRKGMLLAGLGLFGLSSIAGGLGNTPGELIVARCFMGLGAAVIFPATLALIANVFTERRERALAIGLWGATGGIGVAFGPITGGFLLEHFSWPSIFYALAPVAGITAVMVLLTVPTSRDPNAPRADGLGLVLSSAGMALLVFTVIEAPRYGWGSARSIVGFVLATALLGLFVGWERHTSEPMLDVRLFRNPRFTAASGSVTISWFSLSGFIFLVTLYFQFLKGYGPLSTGVRLLPVALSIGLTSVLGTKLALRFGTKLVVTAGLVSFAAGLAWTSSASASTSYLAIAGQMLLLGSGVGLTSAPATDAIMSVVPKDKAAIGSAVNDATRVFGATLGVAVIGSVYASLYSSRLTGRLPANLPQALSHTAHQSVGAALAVSDSLFKAHLPAPASAVHAAASSAFFHGFSAGTIVAAAVALAGSAVAAVFLPSYSPTPGAEEPAAMPALSRVPMPVSMLVCVAGCQSASAAHLGSPIGNGRAENLRRFYESIFGWATAPIGEGYGVIAGANGTRLLAPDRFAALPELQTKDVALFVETSSLADTLERVQDLGGSPVIGPVTTPGGGRVALFSDPEGQLVGLFEPAALND